MQFYYEHRKIVVHRIIRNNHVDRYLLRNYFAFSLYDIVVMNTVCVSKSTLHCKYTTEIINILVLLL